MKKNISVAVGLKHWLGAAGLFGISAGAALGQSFGQPVEPLKEQQSASAVTTTPEAYGVRGLPSITNSDQRQQQIQQRVNRGIQERKPGANGDMREPMQSKSVFADYVRTVTGDELELFGKKLFIDVPSTFAPFDSAQVNGDYVIGSGDELQIRGWGMVNVDVTTTVDRNGAIYIPRVGNVKVAGVRYRDLQGHLKQAVGKNFSNFELTASVSQTRAIQIYVVGHAVKPGTYTLNSMSTLLNALFSSGGPDASGSMRNIQLKRGTQTVTTFDLYDMLVDGDKSRDATLRDGDVIYIPEVGPLAALTGNVKTPGIFELKSADSVADMLNWAGGVDSSSDQKQIIVEKTVNNSYQTVAEMIGNKEAIKARLGAIPVRAADVVRVFAPGAVAVQAQLQNEYVRVSGEVKQSGVFQIRKGETLRELMVRLGGVRDTGYVFATELKRESVKRFQQKKLEEMAERFERDVESTSAQRLAGSTDKDAVATQSAELERQRRIAASLRAVKPEGRIVLELEDGSSDISNLPDMPLQDGDSVFIPRKPGTVEVLGAVFQANSFIYKPRRTVNDYVLLAGGETATAEKSEMYIIRADGTSKSGRGSGWLGGLGGTVVIVVPEVIERTSWRQSLKEWTAIFYQFGLGAAGLKVLKD
jgi:protein involved in polysaccharide export with SLBB domain